jgi:hypothetical protein
MPGADKRSAGPSLKALAAAAIGRLVLQLDLGADPPDYSLAGVWRGEIAGLTLVRTTVISIEPPDVDSRVTWEIRHAAWSLTFIERRQFTGDKFARSAPYQVALSGDLLEAARFLNIPKELFLQALRADGWSAASTTLEQLRWLPAPSDSKDFKFVIQSV